MSRFQCSLCWVSMSGQCNTRFKPDICNREGYIDVASIDSRGAEDTSHCGCLLQHQFFEQDLKWSTPSWKLWLAFEMGKSFSMPLAWWSFHMMHNQPFMSQNLCCLYNSWGIWGLTRRWKPVKALTIVIRVASDFHVKCAMARVVQCMLPKPTSLLMQARECLIGSFPTQIFFVEPRST